MLDYIQQSLGDQPRDIVRGAADEILAILKNDRLKAHDKKKDVEKLLGKVTDIDFASLVDMGKKITDYTEENDEPTEGKSTRVKPLTHLH